MLVAYSIKRLGLDEHDGQDEQRAKAGHQGGDAQPLVGFVRVFFKLVGQPIYADPSQEHDANGVGEKIQRKGVWSWSKPGMPLKKRR